MGYEYSKGYIVGQLNALEMVGNDAGKNIAVNIKAEFELLCNELETPDENPEDVDKTPGDGITLPDYTGCKTLAEAIEALHQTSGLSHGELQKACGLSQTTWLKIRTKGLVPRAKGREGLQDAFHIPDRLFVRPDGGKEG